MAFVCFFFNDTATTEIYTLSLHDALPISGLLSCWRSSRRSKTGTPATWLLAGIALCAVVGLGVLTWNQVQVWHDSERLWTHVLAIDPQSSIAENNLGGVRADQKKPAEAIEHYQRALQIKPKYAEAHYNLGVV